MSVTYITVDDIKDIYLNNYSKYLEEEFKEKLLIESLMSCQDIIIDFLKDEYVTKIISIEVDYFNGEIVINEKKCDYESILFNRDEMVTISINKNDLLYNVGKEDFLNEQVLDAANYKGEYIFMGINEDEFVIHVHKGLREKIEPKKIIDIYFAYVSTMLLKFTGRYGAEDNDGKYLIMMKDYEQEIREFILEYKFSNQDKEKEFKANLVRKKV